MNLAKLDLTNSIYKETEYRPIIELESGAHSFDSYHNSFFESYWSKNTHLKMISLNLRVNGQGTLALIRKIGNQENLIEEIQVNNHDFEDFKIEEELESHSNSRIYLKVSTSSKFKIINNAYWNTNDLPQKDVRLAVIMCTFNKQEYVKRNLELLNNHVDFQSSDTELIIVDNASNLDLNTSNKLHYFSQGNYGGAGGFTRGLTEARKMGYFTHYQFMDDDVLLDPDMILRAKAFISFLKEDHPFSGAMLCMDKKNTLWEQGASYPSSERSLTTKPCFFNRDLDSSLLEEISTPYGFDYGGWWFFTFSEEMVKKIGLPYPFFIRGDDVEYSLRLKEAGYSILSLPGVCVWHETFFGKTAYWLIYYKYRNFLMINLLYFTWGKLFISIFQTIRAILSDLLFYQYQKVQIANLAIKDIIFFWYHYHYLSTPQNQRELLTKIKEVKDECVEEVKLENIKKGEFRDFC